MYEKSAGGEVMVKRINFEFATKDDCLNYIIPSDLRALVSERDKAEQRIEALERESTQRGARMQIMRDWMEETPERLWGDLWQMFLGEHPNSDYQDWFDADGVPVKED